MKVAMIPARGGSKRILKKNIKEFFGKPLISYSIKAALESQLFDRVIVSTDSEEVAEVARECGAEVPFLRPVDLADDFSPLAVVTEHTINWLEQEGFRPQYLCGIFATAPLISVEDLREGYGALNSYPRARSALAVTNFSFPIQRALRLTAENGVEMIQPDYQLTRSQDLEAAYHDAGQFFWKALGEVDFEGCRPIFVDRFRVQDIDTEEDWAVAELQYLLVQEKLKKSPRAVGARFDRGF